MASIQIKDSGNSVPFNMENLVDMIASGATSMELEDLAGKPG
jgi:hypothetical protein